MGLREMASGQTALQETPRYKYIDVAKFLGIAMIYLGHLGGAGGAFYYFVFSFHVPLFFFLSGCTDRISTKRNPVQTICNRARAILLPWFVFAVLSLIVYVIFSGDGIGFTVRNLFQIALGTIRNRYISAVGLWFLTCLFVTSCLFALIKLLKNPVLILLVCGLLHVSAQRLLPNNPFIQPSWPWNVDSAMYYIVYYAIGYVSFPALSRWFKQGKLSLFLIGCCCFMYAACYFFGRNLLGVLYQIHWTLNIVVDIVQTCLLIQCCLLFARALEGVSQLAEIGRNTLYLCGSETMVSLLFGALLNVFGLERSLPTPLSAFVYVAVILTVTNRYLVPVEKKAIQTIERITTSFFVKTPTEG